MKRYRAILLDADGTVFDYDKAERRALRETLGLYNLPFDEKTLRLFRRIREEQETLHEQGEISVRVMHNRRFSRFLEEARLPPESMEFASLYAVALEKHIDLNSDVLETCDYFCKSIPLYIVTNGPSAIQRARILASPVIGCLAGFFISEEIGFPKPHQYFFDSVFMELEEIGRGETLLVGDSLSCDIVGGNAAGIDTCWYNPKEKTNPGQPTPTYEIRSFIDLIDIVTFP